MPERIPQSATIRVPLQAYLASDHITPATGKTIAITISQNGGNYGNPSVGATNAVEIGSGSYYVDLSTTDTGTLGPLFVKGTEGTIDNIIAIYNVVNANNAGLAALPNAAANANGGLPILSVSGTTLAYTVSTVTTYTGNTPQTGDNYVRLGAPAGASIAADLAEIEAETDALLAGVTVTVNNDKTGYDVTSFNGHASVGGKDWYHALWYMSATTAGLIPGTAGTAVEIWQDFSGVVAVAFTVDAFGNRTAAVYS